MTVRPFSPEDDAVIAEMRAKRQGYREIGAKLGRSLTSVYDRARAIGVADKPAVDRPPPRSDEAKPAGHPACWTVISREPWPGPLPVAR